MTIANPRVEAGLRQGFKRFNSFMLLMWRLGLGGWVNAWPAVGGRIMVLTHKGRKTGKTRRTPVNYAIVDGELYCTAGFGAGSDWYRNILADPHVEVWLPDGWWQGTAEDVSDAPNRLELLRQVLIGSGIVAPLMGVSPGQPEAQLMAATETYRLIHIRRAQPCTGPSGPGDLAWVWPLTTMLLLMVALRRRQRS